MNLAGGDDVVGYGLPGEKTVPRRLDGRGVVDLVLGAIGQQCRKVPLQHGGGGYGPSSIEFGRLLEGALEGEGEEGLVLEDGPVDPAAVTPVEGGHLVGAGAVVEEGGGVPVAVAPESVDRAVPLVAARFHGDVHGGPRVVPLGGVVVVGDLHLLDRLGGGLDLGLLAAADGVPHVVDAVEGETDGVSAGAVKIEAGGDGPPRFVPLPTAARRTRRAGRQDQQVARIPLSQRQGLDPLVVDEVAQGGVAALKQRRLRLDRHFLGDLAHLQREVQQQGVASAQLDRLLDGLEPGQRDGQLVFARLDVVDPIGARIVAHGGEVHSGGDVGRRHRNAGDDAAGVVHYAATDGAAGSLGPDGTPSQ